MTGAGKRIENKNLGVMKVNWRETGSRDVSLERDWKAQGTSKRDDRGGVRCVL